MSPRRVVAYWHDSEGTLVAGCDDGTCWNWVWGTEWKPRVGVTVPSLQIAGRPGTILDFLHEYVYGSEAGPSVSDDELCRIAEQIEAKRRGA